MKRARSYPQVLKRWYRPAEHECPACHRTLREAMTLTRRTVVLRLEMVDTSSNPLQTHFGPVFGDEAVQTGLLFPE